MSDPTESEIQATIGYGIRALENVRLLGESDTPNILSLESSMFDSVKGDYAPGVMAGWRAFRAAYNGVLTPRVVQTLLTPGLQLYGKFIGSRATDASTILRELYDHFHDNNKQVEKRVFTFDTTPTAGGGNVGDGTVHRLNVDANGYDIDIQTADTKTLKCVSDEHSGAQEHQEEFEIRGETRKLDFLSLTGGTGTPGDAPVGRLTALSPVQSETYIRNPSFHQHGLSYSSDLATPTTVTDITGWTLGSTSDVKVDKSLSYRDSLQATNQASLRFDGNQTISQNLNTIKAQFQQTNVGFGQEIVPMYVEVAVYRESSCDGTLTLTFGASSVAVDVTTLTNSAWNIVRIAVGTGNWFANFNTEDPVISLALASNTVGSILMDEIVVAPFQFFDGGWWAVVGGATPFLRGDTLTLTDTVAETGLIQKWLARGYNAYLPSTTSGSEEWADPTVP